MNNSSYKHEYAVSDDSVQFQ